MIASDMWSGTGSGGGPVWLPVLAARFAGGLAGGVISFAVLSHATDLGALVPAVVSALVTGVVLVALLPGMSGRTISPGNALVASFAGAALPVLGTLLVTGGFTASARGTLVLSGSGVMMGIATTVLGLALTAWLVSSSSIPTAGWKAASGEQSDWAARPPSELPAVEIDQVQPVPPAVQPESGYWAALEDRAPAGPE